MKFSDVLNRKIPPEPWSEGEKIPWDEPEFSRRMLKYHLSQDSDAASRRTEIIDSHVEWISALLGACGSKNILDLACGPGLYGHRLSRKGHKVKGIDFSPASIEWARNTASNDSLDIEFVHSDVRSAEYGEHIDLAMLLFGEIDVFSKTDVQTILRKVHASLNDGGLLLLEPHEEGVVKANFATYPRWSTHESSLFSEHAHFLLEEGFWLEEDQAAVKRWYVVDANSGDTQRYSQTVQAYSKPEFAELVESCGFDVQDAPDGWITGKESIRGEFYSLVATKKR
jgi:SAM-dependent methyltransferase